MNKSERTPPSSFITVACCWWNDWPSGDPDVGLQYVNKLFRATENFLTIPHRFVCFAEHLDMEYDEGIEVLPIELPTRQGEVAKFMFYKPNNGLTGRVLGMDLDTVIIRNIDEFIRDEQFIVRAAFGSYRREHHVDKGIGGDMVSFNAGFGRHLWTAISKATDWFVKKTRGDERKAYANLLKQEQITFWQDVLPGRYVSKKMVLHNYGLSENTSVVSFHGNPRPHEIDHPLVNEFWHKI